MLPCYFGFGPWTQTIAWQMCRWLVSVVLVDCWDSAGFRCGGWLVVGCRVLPVWTGSVFGSRFPVWSVVWVFHVGDRVVVDCRSVRDSLESGGFVVLPWLVVGCRSVLVWTGSDSVVWFPIQSA